MIVRSRYAMKAAGLRPATRGTSITLLVPPGGRCRGSWGTSRPRRDRRRAQYEGEAYVGRGVIRRLVVAFAWAPRKILECARVYWVLCAMLLALAVYAASNRVYAADRLLIAYDLPTALVELSSYFRASGRFIWPLTVTLWAIPPLACVFPMVVFRTGGRHRADRRVPPSHGSQRYEFGRSERSLFERVPGHDPRHTLRGMAQSASAFVAISVVGVWGAGPCGALVGRP